ncbi:MAG: 4-(cytidine 5'-diphospho)-2-C-methyl-D-erythritol kinase [Omnitrophica bacterium]|nr:4-(cytidine 5'-diphospho)-2-C-methyl-D-erythritol kinase [Candidatus Omnitrophota bacterium]
MILYAPAKINLYLKVLNKRSDGYHNIETVFERIALYDKIILRKSDKIKVLCNNSNVPTDKNSLIYKTISLFKERAGVSKGVEVKIFKKIPVASGLGGGSSDAASLLGGLSKFWGSSLDPACLLKIGRSLGADIAFFLNKASFAFAGERGDRIIPFEWKEAKFWHLLISPPVKTLSKDIYQMFSNEIRKKPFSRLTKGMRINKILSPGLMATKPKKMKNAIRNDLERVVLKVQPIVNRLKAALGHIGLTHSMVSGSGPSVFSLFEKRKEAMRAKGLLVKRFPFVKGKGWRIFIVPTA